MHFVIAIILIVIIAVDCFIIVQRMCIPAPVTVQRTNVSDVPLQLDPNVASAEALAALPGLSSRQARQIVIFRENFLEAKGQKQCFNIIEDLDDVRHIGPKTLEKVGKYLRFPH